MLGRIFIVLCRVPGLKKILWRSWYDYLARSHRAPEWTFMNYGYASETNNLTLSQADEPDRHWIQLYHHVAGSVDLEGCTVLEVGSGRGGGSSFVKRYLRPRRMIGVDLSKSAVALSRETHRIDGQLAVEQRTERLAIIARVQSVVVVGSGTGHRCARSRRLVSWSSKGRNSLSIASRARKIRERTVPIGQSILAAISS